MKILKSVYPELKKEVIKYEFLQKKVYAIQSWSENGADCLGDKLMDSGLKPNQEFNEATPDTTWR